MKTYFVPNFPVSKIKVIGEDGWVHMPKHPKRKYGWLEAVLELIENTGKIDPIQMTVWDEENVVGGPCGANRLYALINIKKVNYVPVIVYTKKMYDWFGDGCEEITNADDVLKYFREDHRPEIFNFEKGHLTWQTKNVYDPKKIMENMKVSEETKKRLMLMLEEEKLLGML